MKALLPAVLLVGCWRGEPPPPSQPAAAVAPPAKSVPPPSARTQADLALEAMRGFKDQMCACTDKACSDRVREELVQWSTEMARSMDTHPGNLTEEQMRGMQELGMAYAECMIAVMQATP